MVMISHVNQRTLIKCVTDNTRVCMTEGFFRQEFIGHHCHKLHGNVLILSEFSQALIVSNLGLRAVVATSLTIVMFDGYAL